MKTETEVDIRLVSLEPEENSTVEPQGYLLKFFMGCSQVYSKPFKVVGSQSSLDQSLKIKNILGEELQVWLCNLSEKIIANATVALIKEGDQNLQVQLKLNGVLFAKLNCSLSITKNSIEKLVYVQPDEQLLRKQEDPETARLRQEQQRKRLKQVEEQEKLAQLEKKHAITRTHRNKKDEPFL